MSDSPAPVEEPTGIFARIFGPFSNMGRTLNDPIYGPYALGNFLSVNGVWVQRLGIGWLTWELTESPGWLGAVAFADLFPLAVLAPLAGAATDRWYALNLLRLSTWLIAMQSLVLLFLFHTGLISVHWILILTASLGGLMALNQPSRLAVEPSLVSPDRLPSAIAISSLSYNGGQFFGAALFAFLIPKLGVASAFIFQAATFAIFSIILIRTRPRTAVAKRKKSEGGIITDLREGFSYSWNHIGIKPLMVLLACIAVGTRATADLFAAYSDTIFNRGAEGLGVLTSSIGSGAVLGILMIARFKGTKGLVNTVLMFAPGTCVAALLFIATDMLWVGAMGALCLGFSYMPVAVGSQTLMQSAVDPAMRGRVMAIYVSVWRAMPAIGALAMGNAAEFVGLRWPPLTGVVLVLIVLAWLWVQRRTIADALENGPKDTQAP